ncbi:DUF488 domain-containing protein [Candidatus Methylospira mobilis]|uniref:DUF488 domain-containing protein n=1 Tax=Candidatus Methylospira mobilis TaxID=1808979 RepID=UPI001D17A6E1|nr:DUF488 domain-containing protein [Candidatus Methylospira mobilis]
MNVFTIGYEGLDLDAFISALTLYGVETVVDIREVPLSRKPGFSKKALANALNLSGFEYLTLGEVRLPETCPRLLSQGWKLEALY